MITTLTIHSHYTQYGSYTQLGIVSTWCGRNCRLYETRMTACEGTTLKQGNHYVKHEMFGTYK